jgi:predicted phage terminase large subunit-like protein
MTAQKQFAQYKKVQNRIIAAHQRAGGQLPNETPSERTERIARLRTDFVAFAQYYFPHYCDADFGWFHQAAATKILADKDIFIVLEWAREHAKSVFADVMMPMLLYARGELSGMVIASDTQEKAIALLSDLQAEWVSNPRWIADYGELAQHGTWQKGNFATNDGVGFWAFGLGQSPRGIREQQRRPNYCVVDDADNQKRCLNDDLTNQAVQWILEDLYGALGLRGARLVVAGNRIHRQSILAKIVGDTAPDQPKRQGIEHIKVFAIEDPDTHAAAALPEGKPAWHERYTAQHFARRFQKIGYRATQREYFHEPIAQGTLFEQTWITWHEIPPLTQVTALVCYCDPSFAQHQGGDYKAIVSVALTLSSDAAATPRYYVLDAWVRRASIGAMVAQLFDCWHQYGERAEYYVEANAAQSLLLRDFEQESLRRNDYFPIRADRRAKPNKTLRIENLTPLFERQQIAFNVQHRQNTDMQLLVQQLLAFPQGSHDDAPDALEGAIYYLQRWQRGRR